MRITRSSGLVRIVPLHLTSNELSTPKVLLRPMTIASTGAMWGIANTKISYFACQDRSEGGNPGILTRDRIFLVQPNVSCLPKRTECRPDDIWLVRLHGETGNV
jgi:hypothetical protein